jgi:oligopeptidase B
MHRRKFLSLSAATWLSSHARASYAVEESNCEYPAPPVTRKIPDRIEQLGRVRVDDYAWLKDPNWKEVWKDPATLNATIRAHLRVENAYARAVLKPTLPLQETLFAEMAARSRGDDAPPPWPDGPWLYSRRFAAGAQHPSWYRRRRDGQGGEELLLDGGERAQGRAWFNIVHAKPSPDQKLFAWAEDATGGEKFRIYVKDLGSGEIFPHPAENAYGEFVFSADSAWIYWVYRDANSRPSRVYRRPARGSEDTLLYTETDPALLMTVSHTASRRYVMIRSWNAVSSEVRLIASTHPAEMPRVVEPRTPGLVYSVEDWQGRLVILTNADGATNFKLMWADEAAPSRQSWRDWIAYKPAHYITGMQAFRDYFVRMERVNANPRIVVTHAGDMREHAIAFDEAAYAADVEEHQEYGSHTLRYLYQSPRQPRLWIDYDMATARPQIVKAQTVGHGFDPRQYIVEQLEATAADGAKVPVTVLRHRNTKLDGSAPMLLYGYASYGYFVPPEFSAPVLSLVDRGWVYAIAHPRGGSAKGWTWYLQARQLHKKLTFTDFISCAEMMIHKGYSSKARIVVYGFSAGGLLAGAVLNMRPDLWSGVIAEAPFVDMLNTMSDPTHPLVPLTYPDWGNPLASPAAYDSIASYSPYDNVTKQAYPPVLATTSVADDRVGYWEPAKWIARLRADDTSHTPKLLRVEMGGHGGAVGRYARLHQTAMFYAFAISTLKHCL